MLHSVLNVKVSENNVREFPGHLMIKVLGFFCLVLGTIPGPGTDTIKLCSLTKKKKKKDNVEEFIHEFKVGKSFSRQIH